MENTTRTELLGIEVNRWGLYCAVGAAFALIALAVVCHSRNMKKGAAPVLGIFSIICGIIVSRISFCLLNSLSGTVMMFRTWLRVSYGGWSMFGMIGGVMAGAVISALIIREKPGKMLDAVSVSIPLLIAAVRQGEQVFGLFNVTRSFPNDIGWLRFLTVQDMTGRYRLAVFHIATGLAIILFLIMAVSFAGKKREDGDLWVEFMLLCGAGGIFSESLRNDQFLVYSFVQMEQVMAALMFAAGIILSVVKNRKRNSGFSRLTLFSFTVTLIESVAVMFALDRTDASHVILYGILFVGLAVPAVYGMMLIRHAWAGKSVTAVQAAAMLLEGTGFAAILYEIFRLGQFNFLLTSIAAATLIMTVTHAVILFTRRFRISVAQNQ